VSRGTVPTIWIVIAHGSRAPGTTDDHERLCRQLASDAGDTVDHVLPAYLEINDPTIPAAIDAAVADGAQQLVLLPYFLHAGNHTRRDIPEIMDSARQRHPGVDLVLAPHLGPDQRLTEILLDRAVAATEDRGG
jgi:sirohydrochlorin cobaltochelatase